jgi:hypothetical protein
MATYEVVLAKGNDERHLYVDVPAGDTNPEQTAKFKAETEWMREFGLSSIPKFIDIRKLP